MKLPVKLRVALIAAALVLSSGPSFGQQGGGGGGANTSFSNVQLPTALNNLGFQIPAKCDVVETMNDGAIAATTNQFISSAITFTSADVGKAIVISGAGAAGAPLATTIVSVSGHTATLNANAATTAPHLTVEDVQPQTRQSGVGSYAPGDTITLAGGTSTTAAIATVDLTEVQSATVAAGGSGGTNGTQTVTGTTGTVLGTSGFFTASVTVSGNTITAVLSITYSGLYTANPTTLTAEPVTGAGLVGAQLSLKMGVQNAHPSTAGVYTIATGRLTQSSTSGNGTGATFTPTFNQTDWYYGSDDGATINAALALTPYNGSFLLPVGGCGTTVPIVLPTANFPGSSPILRGQGKNMTRLYALGAMSQVLDTGTTFGQGGGARDLAVDAFGLATNGIMTRRATGVLFLNVTAKNAITANWGSGGASSYADHFDQIEGYTDNAVFPAALRSTYSFDASSLADAHVANSVFYNAATADIRDAPGAGNKFIDNHTYGYPINFRPQYGIASTGLSAIIGHEFDGASVAQLQITYGGTVASGFVQWNNNTVGSAWGVEIAGLLSNIDISGIVFNPASNVPAAQAVHYDGAAPTASIVTNQGNFGSLAVGGSLMVGGNTTLCGADCFQVYGPPNAPVISYIEADQTTGISADLYFFPRVGAGGTGIIETGNASDLLLGTNFVEGMRLNAATHDVLFKQHVRVSGSPPVLTSCGTSPAITGSDIAGQVTMGTATPTGCIITFAVAYTSAPNCTVTWQATPLVSQSYAITNAAITLTQTATSSNKVNYVCAAQTGG